MRVLRDDSFLVLWTDKRDGQAALDLYGQRVSSQGVTQWTTNGREILDITLSGVLRGVEPTGIVDDDAGGCFVSLDDGREDPLGDVSLLRLDAQGAHVPGWESGRAVSASTTSEGGSLIVPAADGGFRLCFSRLGAMVQRFNGSGSELWETGGRLVWPGGGFALSCVVSDEHDGLIMVGGRDGSSIHGLHRDLVATRVDPEGVPLWGIEGIAVSTALYDQLRPRLASDHSGGAFVVWEDQRAGPPEWDIYAQHINADGSLGGAVTSISATAVSAVRREGAAHIEWSVHESAGGTFEAQRSVAGGEWRTLARLLPDGRGRVALEDRYAPERQMLAYRLAWPTARGTSYSQPITLMPETSMTLTLSVSSPAEDRTRIEYVLPRTSRVRLDVFDLAGRRLAVLGEGIREPGVHRVEWSPRSDSGVRLASGLYAVRLVTDEEVVTRRLILAR